MKALITLIAACAMSGCVGQRSDDDARARHEAVRKAREESERKVWEGPCRDTAHLLATTAGSPSNATCTNKLHRMRVQAASAPSNEEFGAVVFCECLHEPVPPVSDAGQ